MSHIVIVGGWVPLIYHYLYARPSSGGEPLGTSDVDIVVPSELDPQKRERIEDALATAGYESSLGRVLGEDEASVIFEQTLSDGTLSQIQFLTPQQPNRRSLVQIGGQEPLTAQALPYHNVLLDNPVMLSVGTEFDPSLTRSLLANVPSPAAFVYVKGLTWERRDDNDKNAKDLAYIVDLLARYPSVRADVIGELPSLFGSYPSRWSRRFRTSLAGAFSAPGSIWSRRVAEQLTDAGLRRSTVESVAQEAFVVVQELLSDLRGTKKG